MNKYESGGAFSKDNRAAKLEFDKLYLEFREIVLNNKDYKLGKAKDILNEMDEKDARKMFEMFNYQEGALPDNLAAEYVKLIYSPDSFRAKMAMGKSFYEALSVIAWEIKNAHIELDSELVDTQVKLSAEELENEKSQTEEK